MEITATSIILARHEDKNVHELASVVAEAMATNPINMAVFRLPQERSKLMQSKLFSLLFSMPACNLVVARQNDKVVGVMNYYEPGECQMPFSKMIRYVPKLVQILGPKLPRVLKWKAAWEKHDPTNPHLHLGPLAVLPDHQGKGIGSQLLRQMCSLSENSKLPIYLETDKEENVALYERFEFRIISEDTVFGVKNWFMWREAR